MFVNFFLDCFENFYVGRVFCLNLGQPLRVAEVGKYSVF